MVTPYAAIMDFYSVFGYLSGIFFIRPDMAPSVLIPTASLIHLLDASLCRIIALHSGRNKNLWSLAGLVLGFWALGTLFLLVEIRGGPKGRSPDNQDRSQSETHG